MHDTVHGAVHVSVRDTVHKRRAWHSAWRRKESADPSNQETKELRICTRT